MGERLSSVRSKAKGALLAVLFFFGSLESSHACVIDQKQDLKFLRGAELVMRARILEYHSNEHHGEFTLAPVEIILGPTGMKSARSVKARWVNSTFGVPPRWNGPSEVLLGLNAVFDNLGNPVIEVARQSCGPASIYPDSQEFRCEVVNLLFASAPKFHCPPRRDDTAE
jgi:hypothetical protein